MIEPLTIERLKDIGLSEVLISNFIKYSEFETSISNDKGLFFASNKEGKIYSGVDAYRLLYVNVENPDYPTGCPELTDEYYNAKETKYLKLNSSRYLTDEPDLKEEFRQKELIYSENIIETLINKKQGFTPFSKERFSKDIDTINDYKNWLTEKKMYLFSLAGLTASNTNEIYLKNFDKWLRENSHECTTIINGVERTLKDVLAEPHQEGEPDIKEFKPSAITPKGTPLTEKMFIESELRKYEPLFINSIGSQINIDENYKLEIYITRLKELLVSIETPCKQRDLLKEWISDGTRPQFKNVKYDFSNDIKLLFEDNSIIEASDLSIMVNDLINKLLDFEWWFYRQTKYTYSIELLNNQVLHKKNIFKSDLSLLSYEYYFKKAIERINLFASDKLDKYISLWPHFVSLAQIRYNNPLYRDVFSPMIECLKRGEDYRHFGTLLNPASSNEPPPPAKYPVIDQTKYNPDKIYEKFNKVLFICSTEEVFNCWFVSGVGHIERPEVVKKRGNFRDLWLLLKTIIKTPDEINQPYFKKVFNYPFKHGDLKDKNVLTLSIEDKLKECIK